MRSKAPEYFYHTQAMKRTQSRTYHTNTSTHSLSLQKTARYVQWAPPEKKKTNMDQMQHMPEVGGNHERAWAHATEVVYRARAHSLIYGRF